MSDKRGLPLGNDTDAAQAGLNVTVTPIEEFCYSGIQKRMLEIFGVPAVWTQATDEIRAVRKALIQSGGSDKITYPYITLRKTTFSRPTDRGSIVALHSFGTRVRSHIDQNIFYQTSLVPIEVAVNVKYVTDSEKTLNHFANSWFMAASAGHLTFDIEYGETDVSVGVILSESVSFPTREADPNNAPEYIVEAEMKCLMYLSDPVLRQGKLATSIQVDGFIATEEESSSRKVLPISRSIWSFKS